MAGDDPSRRTHMRLPQVQLSKARVSINALVKTSVPPRCRNPSHPPALRATPVLFLAQTTPGERPKAVGAAPQTQTPAQIGRVFQDQKVTSVIVAFGFDPTPIGDISIVLRQRLGKGVTAGAIGNKEDIIRVVRVHRRIQTCKAGVGNRGRW